MAIGYSALVTRDAINSQAGSLALRWWQVATETQAWHTNVVLTLRQSGLVQVGFTGDPNWAGDPNAAEAGEAGRLRYAADVMNTMSALFFGQAAQPDKFSFADAEAEVRGPQV